MGDRVSLRYNVEGIEMEDFSFSELIKQQFIYGLEDVHTAIPAVVLKFNDVGRKSTVDVQPLVSIVSRDGSIDPQTSILNVPLQQPASSVGGMVFPIREGDNVLLVYAERAIDTWKYGTGSPAPASDYRRFDMKDCFAIPCVFPTSKAMSSEQKQGPDYSAGDTAVYNLRGGKRTEIIIKQNGDIIINSPGTTEINCSDAVVNAGSEVTVNSGARTTVNAGSDAVVNASQDVLIKNGSGQCALSGGGWGQVVTDGPLLIKSKQALRLQGPSGSFTL